MERVANALERLASAADDEADSRAGAAFVWSDRLRGARPAPAPDLALLVGLDAQRAALLENTRRHAHGLPAHDALLWGARGMGKSALARAVVARVRSDGADLAMVGLADAAGLSKLFARLGDVPRRFVVFADDLTVDDPASRRALRSVLDGGVEARPENCRLYVTSNRRHLARRDFGDADAPSPRDALDDALALADRFGLSLGFHAADQPTYLAIVEAYAHAHGLPFDQAEAVRWSLARGARSGRVAWQYTQEVAARAGRRLANGHPAP